MPACFPPFESVSILLITGLVVAVMARWLTGGGVSKDGTPPPPVSQRAIVFALIYMRLITLCFAGLLLLGWALGFWGV